MKAGALDATCAALNVRRTQAMMENIESDCRSEAVEITDKLSRNLSDERLDREVRDYLFRL